MTIDIGISLENRDQIQSALFKILASYYILLIKTQNYHWNIQTPHFLSYHKMLEDQYKELQDVIDLVAERIRKLGFPVKANTQKFCDHSAVQEERQNPNASEMLSILNQDRETVIKLIRNTLTEIENTKDEGTADMLTSQLRDHEKTAWILRSHLIES
ncbi:MAG: Dps family protein [Janthinobacterium lividum]